MKKWRSPLIWFGSRPSVQARTVPSKKMSAHLLPHQVIQISYLQYISMWSIGLNLKVNYLPGLRRGLLSFHHHLCSWTPPQAPTRPKTWSRKSSRNLSRSLGFAIWGRFFGAAPVYEPVGRLSGPWFSRCPWRLCQSQRRTGRRCTCSSGWSRPWTPLRCKGHRWRW